jgi:hypothetical protein
VTYLKAAQEDSGSDVLYDLFAGDAGPRRVLQGAQCRTLSSDGVDIRALAPKGSDG